MRSTVAILLAVLTGTPVLADNPRHRAFHGIWGTPAQCNREPITVGGSVRAEPFEISAAWLRHGAVWCQLSWGPVESREDSLFTVADARCGEDAVRDYFLGLTRRDGSLVLRWQPFYANGPLARCAAP